MNKVSLLGFRLGVGPKRFLSIVAAAWVRIGVMSVSVWPLLRSLSINLRSIF
jgi:hypothetical protein